MTTQQYNNKKPTYLFYNIYMDKRELIQRATETIYEKLIYTLESVKDIAPLNSNSADIEDNVKQDLDRHHLAIK